MEENKSNNQKVLICEDEVTTAFCIQKILQKTGYESDIAYTAKQAEEFLAVNEYKLMTLDLILPDKNGLVLLEEISNNDATKDLPIIILSASEPNKTDAKISPQVVYWLEKSFDLNKFEKTVNDIIAKKNTKKVKILHLEDDSDLLNLICLTINDIADISPARNLKQAEEALKTTIYDIIIMDYKLSDGTCEKIVNNIKNTPNKDAKLLLFSAYEPERAIIDKFDKIILKSTVSAEDFIDCIKTL